MAIIFTNDLPIDKWLLSENNRVVEFFSDYAEPAVYCDITIGALFPIRIYPLPDNTFWFNFKKYFSSQLKDYADDLDLTVNPADIDTFIKDWSKIFLNDSIEFLITFEDDTTEDININPSVFLGAEQPYNYKLGQTIESNSNVILSPLKLKTSNKYYMKYWDGYPFDIGYTLERTETTATHTITNLTNTITTPNIDYTQTFSRIVVSDGDTTQSLELYLPLVDGLNELEFVGTTDTYYIDLHKVASGCGVYLKWINQYGSYSYWLFNEFYQVDLRAQSLGIINNDFFNLDDTISQSKQLGKDSADTWTVFSDDLNADEMNIAKGILTSPKVYLFTGVRFSQNNFNDWLEVTVNTNSANIKQPREGKNEIKVNIELPNDYNIKL